DPRRLSSSDRLPDDPRTAVQDLSAGRRHAFVRGLRLFDCAPVLIDAAEVFPALNGHTDPYSIPTGTAAAYTWQAALESAILEHGHILTLEETMTSAEVDLGALDLDSEGARCLAQLKVVGLPVAGYDITGPLGLPTVLVHHAGAPSGCAGGLNLETAATKALVQTLLRYQARNNDEIAYLPPPVPDIRPEVLSRSNPARPPRNTDIGSLIGTLHRNGRSPVAVPLDHDVAVHAVMPYVVRVVLSHG